MAKTLSERISGPVPRVSKKPENSRFSWSEKAFKQFWQCFIYLFFFWFCSRLMRSSESVSAKIVHFKANNEETAVIVKKILDLENESNISLKIWLLYLYSHTFWHPCPKSVKIVFLDSSCHELFKNISLIWFLGGSKFDLRRHYDVIGLICINFVLFLKNNKKFIMHAKFQIHIFWNHWVILGR